VNTSCFNTNKALTYLVSVFPCRSGMKKYRTKTNEVRGGWGNVQDETYDI